MHQPEAVSHMTTVKDKGDLVGGADEGGKGQGITLAPHGDGEHHVVLTTAPPLVCIHRLLRRTYTRSLGCNDIIVRQL
ncbi:hypothetical protein GUJ93_ZPchr0013g37080 [Zizania palustris]|uniref:Uncharacterized protein n=1 Tax=Zizania palustris TaxID=103762 RepID=A0A8J5X2G0_ZIZPA|nr:hypothetical protein GUJ93_ZPchr0013g37080 [Zizania palustris]